MSEPITVSIETLVNHAFLKVEYDKPCAPGEVLTAPGEVRDQVFIGIANVTDIKTAFTNMTGLEWKDTNTVSKDMFHADGEPITVEDLQMFADLGTFVLDHDSILKETNLKRLTLASEGWIKQHLREMPTVTMVGTASIAPNAPCACGSGKKFKKCCQFK